MTVTPDQSLRAFDTALETNFGPDYPRPLAGDLSDLLHSAAAFQQSLVDLLQDLKSLDREKAERRLRLLRIWITSDLPPIFRDVVRSIDHLTADAGSSPQAPHPYADLDGTALWSALQEVLHDLEDNQDVEVSTAEQYVVGLIARRLCNKNLVAKAATKTSKP